VLSGTSFDNDRFDSGKMKKLRQQKAGWPPTDHGNACFHGETGLYDSDFLLQWSKCWTGTEVRCDLLLA
jgi:hypothetical protein